MGWLSDTFLGKRPDMSMAPGMEGDLDDIGEAGNVGVGLSGKYGKHDMKAAKEGRLEQMIRLRPVIAAISARAGSDYKTGSREIGKSMAFENQPVLQAALETELSDKINENAGLQFADASADAYDSASDDAESARRYKRDMQYRAASDRARIASQSMYDRNRQGGLLQSMMQQGMSTGMGMAAAAI